MRLHDDQLRTQTLGNLNGLCRMHAKPPCFVAGCRHHTPFGIVPHRYRLATKLRIVALLYSREKLVHIHVNDFHTNSRPKIRRKYVKRDILHKNVASEYDILHNNTAF